MGDDRPEPRRTGRTTGSSVLTPPTGVPVVPDDPAALLTSPSVGPAPVASSSSSTIDPSAGVCLCGHGTPAHEHWRPGSDCSACGATGCSTFRRRGGRVRGLLRGFRLAR